MGVGAERIEVLLVHPGGPFWRKKDRGAWSIPKGECGGGEARRDCALRELSEEVGDAAPDLDPEALIELGSVRQSGGKVVHAWAAEGDFDPAELRSNSFELEWPPGSGRIQRYPEIDRAAYFDIEAARRKANQAQVAFIDRLIGLLAGRR